MSEKYQKEAEKMNLTQRLFHIGSIYETQAKHNGDVIKLNASDFEFLFNEAYKARKIAEAWVGIESSFEGTTNDFYDITQDILSGDYYVGE